MRKLRNIIAGVIRGQIPYLDEHIEQKREIYRRYKEGLTDLPVKMNPFDAGKSEPNFWLSCLLIDSDAMGEEVRGEKKPRKLATSATKLFLNHSCSCVYHAPHPLVYMMSYLCSSRSYIL